MGIFDSAFNDPNTMGLLAAASGLLQAGGPSRTPISLGQALGQGMAGGMQGYQAAMKAQSDAEEQRAMADYRKAQIGEFQRKSSASAAQQAAIGRLRAKLEADPTYKPTAADLFEIDPESALKSMTGTVDYGLEPKIGTNPETGKPGYFIQDKRGGTKWLGAGVPDSLKLIPPTDYMPAQTFDPRTGNVSPVRPFAPQQPAQSAQPSMSPMLGGMPSVVDSTPMVDPSAPWASLRSPKEQDQMRARVYEQDNKRLDDLRAQVTQGRQVMQGLERFGELNRAQETGGIVDRVSMLPTFDSEKREMEAIAARLAPAQRVPGSGTTSDRDLSLYLASLPGIDKPGDVNKAIREQYAKQLKDAEELVAFKEKYLAEKGYLTGSDEAFRRMKDGGGQSPTAPPVDPNGTWPQINASVTETQPARDSERLQILREELAGETNPDNRAALEREISRMQGVTAPPKPAQKTWAEFGYANQQAVIRDAQNAIMRNPSAKAEIIRRLESSGITNHGLK